MARQHALPLLLPVDGSAARELIALPLTLGIDSVSEATIQSLIFAHPACLPIREIDPLFCNPVPLCTELNTPAGPIDILMVTASGLPVLVECKLWRNPEGRREVVGQILDYAKELSRWSSSDLQREVSRRLKREGNALLELVREAGHEVDEIEFNDALTANLRRGRFLLLIVGDGIREGVEAIAEYLQLHAGLHFTLGLVELPIFVVPGGNRLVVPRVLARTHTLVRTVVATPVGMSVLDHDQSTDAVHEPEDSERKQFWSEFLKGLTLDDPDQRKANATNQGAIFFPLPAPGGSAWLTVYRNIARAEVGLFLSYTRNSDGQQIVRRILDDWDEVSEELGGSVHQFVDTGQKSIGAPRTLIQDKFNVTSLATSDGKSRAFDWLRIRTNDFVNVLRPRIRAAAADLDLETR